MVWGPSCVLQVAVAEYGPVSCAMTVTDNFLLYSAGVYSSNNCSSSYRDMNHAVLIVGYGTADDGLDYWLVKNRSVLGTSAIPYYDVTALV